jgi:hypothetical protein
MTMRASSLAAGIAVLASCLTACAAGSSTTNSKPDAVSHEVNSVPASPSIVHADPLALVGRWNVKAAGQPAGMSLILGEQVTVFEACGQLEGDWRADHEGAFITYLFGGDGVCFHQPHPLSVPWLSHATSYRVHGSSRLLLNASGQVLARLSSGGPPKVSRHDDPSEADAPKITPALRTTLARSPSLPAGLRPATKADLVGRWRALGPHSGSPKGFVRFEDTGAWDGSDGCNGAGGRYAIDGSGRLIITPGGPNGLVGCEMSPAPDWAERARGAGIDSHGDLVLLDVHGKLLGHLARTAAS